MGRVCSPTYADTITCARFARLARRIDSASLLSILRRSSIAPEGATPRPLRTSEIVDRAPHTQTAAIQDVSVDHRGAHVGVTEQLLHSADVGARLEQMRGE
jgi:hypothetical protein